MLVRREEFALGGFDERFFMYLEDVDLCRRYRAAGATIRRDASASVTHLGGGSRTSNESHSKRYRESLIRISNRRVVLASSELSYVADLLRALSSAY